MCRACRPFKRGGSTKKVGRILLIQWSEELRRVVERPQTLSPRVREAIICNRKGNNYTVDGFSSIWYRAIREAVESPDNALQEPFQFGDLRAKSASDDTTETATKRLGHTDPGITEKVYRRAARRVKRLR